MVLDWWYLIVFEFRYFILVVRIVCFYDVLGMRLGLALEILEDLVSFYCYIFLMRFSFFIRIRIVIFVFIFLEKRKLN